MRLTLTGRPSALLPAPVQVVGGSVRSVAPNAVLGSVVCHANEPVTGIAHVAVVGRPAVWTVLTNGNPQQQVRTQLAAYAAVRGGIADLGIDRGKSAMEGASGVPPRGRPV